MIFFMSELHFSKVRPPIILSFKTVAGFHPILAFSFQQLLNVGFEGITKTLIRKAAQTHVPAPGVEPVTLRTASHD